jgi:hypothetical protein|tara:strand:- start:290 stop:484 length:195 start_codon:yes stop_codon:yes gene_type:complete
MFYFKVKNLLLNVKGDFSSEFWQVHTRSIGFLQIAKIQIKRNFSVVCNQILNFSPFNAVYNINT